MTWDALARIQQHVRKNTGSIGMQCGLGRLNADHANAARTAGALEERQENAQSVQCTIRHVVGEIAYRVGGAAYPAVEYEGTSVAEDSGIHLSYLRNDRAEILGKAFECRGIPRLQGRQDSYSITAVSRQHPFSGRSVKSAEPARVDMVESHVTQRSVYGTKLRSAGSTYQIEQPAVCHRWVRERRSDAAAILHLEECFHLASLGADSALLPPHYVAAIRSSTDGERIPATSFRQPKLETDAEVLHASCCPMAHFPKAAPFPQRAIQREM